MYDNIVQYPQSLVGVVYNMLIQYRVCATSRQVVNVTFDKKIYKFSIFPENFIAGFGLLPPTKRRAHTQRRGRVGVRYRCMQLWFCALALFPSFSTDLFRCWCCCCSMVPYNTSHLTSLLDTRLYPQKHSLANRGFDKVICAKDRSEKSSKEKRNSREYR